MTIITDQPVLLTGVTGFIGGHTAVQLLNEGYTVRGSMRNLDRAEPLKAAIGKHAPIDRLSFVQADLLDRSSWDAAVDGCEYVMHIASPFPSTIPKDENELITPAREGTLNVLAAAQNAGVKRVVLTSSVSSVGYGKQDRNRVFNEDDWTDVTNYKDTTPYVRSKAIAERAAWDFVKREGGPELVTINPSIVLGPLLDNDLNTSVLVVKKALDGEVPASVRVGMNLVDVRDVARAHLLAMTTEEANGQRFITDSGFAWYPDIIEVIRAHAPDYSRRLPKLQLPGFLVRLFSIVDPEVKSVLMDVGAERQFDSSRARTVLGWEPISVEATIHATIDSLREHGLIKL